LLLWQLHPPATSTRSNFLMSSASVRDQAGPALLASLVVVEAPLAELELDQIRLRILLLTARNCYHSASQREKLDSNPASSRYLLLPLRPDTSYCGSFSGQTRLLASTALVASSKHELEANYSHLLMSIAIMVVRAEAQSQLAAFSYMLLIRGSSKHPMGG
jgi:hypothetical protein